MNAVKVRFGVILLVVFGFLPGMVQAQDAIETLTVGQIIEEIRQAGHGLIDHGQQVTNDALITLGEVLIHTANAMAAA